MRSSRWYGSEEGTEDLSLSSPPRARGAAATCLPRMSRLLHLIVVGRVVAVVAAAGVEAAKEDGWPHSAASVTAQRRAGAGAEVEKVARGVVGVMAGQMEVE